MARKYCATGECERRELLATTATLKNDHEALVQALSSVLSAWDDLPPGLYSDAEMTEWINSPSMKGAISNAREALALTSAERATVGGEK